MLPELFRIPLLDIPIHTFGVMVATGFITAMWWARREAERIGYPVQKVMDLTFWMMIWGLIGARIMFIIIEWDIYADNPLDIFAVWKGGLVWYGGFIAAVIAGMLLMRRYGLPVLATTDLFSPATMYGLAFGRLGCLSAGDDHGKLVESALGPKAQALLDKGLLYNADGRLTNLATETIRAEGFDKPWWAMVFGPQALMQRDLVGMPIYPTQLAMSFYCLAIFAVLVIWRRYKRFDGELFAALLMLYATARYFLEFWRGDLLRGFWAPGVSTSQGISFVVFGIGLGLYLWLQYRHNAHADNGTQKAGAPA